MRSCMVAALSLLASLPVNAEGPADIDNTVITIARSSSGFSYQLNGTSVKDPLRAFSDAYNRAPHSTAYLMVHEETPISFIENTLGIMSKAQFTSPRVFVYAKDKYSMVELTWGCRLIYSADPSKQTPMHGGYGCKPQ